MSWNSNECGHEVHKGNIKRLVYGPRKGIIYQVIFALDKKSCSLKIMPDIVPNWD